ncbi:hypothetical protein BJP24_18770 [Aeromonas allosaccharophila]|uniref:helicase-related protein n=1 Tax=Aeromonas allosaccharophila TaxID=656 RepID=UPI0005B20DAA|nr:helicase-related protein [Aeromonas allosaccharophila]OKP42721.1 hypothetical protein BJP24_18770 [Aeromonas allosaccharophila]
MTPTTINLGALPRLPDGREPRLHDIADQLPLEAGIHFIQAATGVGKTFHMTTSANDNNGAVVFPVKAILQQEKMSARRDGRCNLTFAQIEKLKSLDLSSIRELHIDECQIMYSGGFRESVEGLIDTVKEASNHIPVYLYSATCNLNLVPIKPDTITNVEGSFCRTLNVVQIQTNSKILQNTKYIVGTIVGAIALEHKPVLVFVQSTSKSNAISRHLETKGITSIVMTSETISKYGSPAMAAYEKMIKHSSVAAGGYQVVIATNCLAEGINFNDDFHVVSTQCEAGLVFQQQGRARKQATHWMIAGEGTDQLVIEGNRLIHVHEGSRRVLQYSESVLTDKSQWQDPAYRDRANLYSLLAEHSPRGCFGVQIIQQLNDYGYQSETLTLPEVEELKALKNISRKALLKAIAEHGLPRSIDQTDHPLIEHLTATRDPVEFEGPLESAIEWHSEWDVIQSMGIRGDCWQVYSKINAIGRKWLVVMLRDIKHRDTVSTVVAEYKKLLTNTRVNKEQMKQLADAFWGQLMDPTIEWKWHAEGQGRMRLNLFRFLMGFVVDDHCTWTLPDPYVGWDVPLSNKDNMAFKRRETIITGAGHTAEAFCNATGHTKKTIADTKTKTIKQLVNGLSMLGI